MVHIESFGSGRSNVVLLHGCPTPPAHIRGLAEGLAPAHRVLLVHVPGYGESPPFEKFLSVDDVSERIEEALIGRGVQEAAVVGYSTGAYRALLLAVRGRLRATAVVSLAGFATLDRERRDAYLGFAEALRSGADLRRALVDLILPPLFAANTPSAVREVESWLRCTSPQSLAWELESYARAPDLLEPLRALEIPLLARVGELDKAQPLAKSQEIVGTAEEGELQLVQGVGHSLFFEDLACTAGAVLKFLAER